MCCKMAFTYCYKSVKIMWEKCYEIKLGETIENIPNNNSIEKLTRVPGGWIYVWGDMEGTTSVFVPFNNEFMKPNTDKISELRE